MKNSSSERKTKTHKIARNWNFIKYKSIQISTNAFLNSSDVEVDKMGWITVISHSLLYMESHIRGITQSCTSPSQPPQPCCPSGWAGPTFIKPDQLDPWIKDQIKITLLPTISHLLLPNFVSCGRAYPSHMTQNLVTVGAKLWTAERFLLDPWSMDYADPVW